MAGLKIDLDKGIEYGIPASRRQKAGVSIRRDPETGSDVFMYRQDPGVYYSANGLQVSATMAKRAGFEVEHFAKEREKLQKMKEFQQSWDSANKTTSKDIVAERGEYHLVHVRNIGYYVEHRDGTNMTPNVRAPTLETGLDWLTDFAGPDLEKASGNVSGNSGPGVGGADRRAGEDGGPARGVRPSGNQKASVPA